MKDVALCDKLWGGESTLWSADFWMGQPSAFSVIRNWIHRLRRQTQGTETSQYLEERTSTETPLVVASERGPGQWLGCKNENRLESRAIAGDSPVRVKSLFGPWVGRDTWNPVWTWGDHPPSLSTPVRPIVNKYREGKVKSTPTRGVK